MEYYIKDKQAIEKLESFLSVLNMEPIQWPADYRQKLVSLNDENEDHHIYEGLSFILNKDLLQVAEKAICKLALRFPKI